MKIERSAAEKRKLDRFGRCESARICYVASGVKKNEVDQALSAVFNAAPALWENVPKYSAELTRSPGGGIVEVAVDYLFSDSSSTSSRRKTRAGANGDREWLVEVNPRNSTRKYAYAHVLSRKIDSGAPDIDPGLLIDWNGRSGSASRSGNVPVMEGSAEITCIATFRSSKAESRAYLRGVAELVGKVNSEAFHNWHAGEVLFAGLKKSTCFEGEHGEDLCNLYFRFFIRTGGVRKVDSVEIAHVDGWDHLWVLPGSKGIHSVHVSRIYPRASFAVLGI